MKTVIPQLARFIQDFELENKDGSVCFTTNIEFRTDHVFKKMVCEIHLVTFRRVNLSTLYFVDPNIKSHHIPDAITYDEKNFFYKENRFLLIEGIVEDTPYILMIYPISKGALLK